MMNLRKLLQLACLGVCSAAVLPAVVSCDASSEDVVLTPSAVEGKQHLSVHFRPLTHGNAPSIDKDGTDKEDLVMNLACVSLGSASTINNSGTQGVANWVGPSTTPGNAPETWSFVANLHKDDKARIGQGSTPHGQEMETAKYLRGYNGLSAALPLLMVVDVPQSQFGAANNNGVRTFSKQVLLQRVFARFSFQTFPLPGGYTLKSVSVKRIPAKFMLVGHTTKPYADLNRAGANNYPYLDFEIWSNRYGNDQPLAKWQKSAWSVDQTANADMFLSGHFYLPPCKVNGNPDPFGTNTDGGMPLLRFVFTDNQNRTFVRLYRLGNSGNNGRGNIDPNAHYNIRINLLAPAKERANNNAVLKAFDEGSSKAAYLN